MKTSKDQPSLRDGDEMPSSFTQRSIAGLFSTDPTDRKHRRHFAINHNLRETLGKRGIVPEQLPPAEEIKKIERRVESEQKKLPKQVKPLESDEAKPNE
jgi:hypothetical protein